MTLPGAKWFKPQPMGLNELNSLMKDCAAAAGLGSDKRIANHSEVALIIGRKKIYIPSTITVQWGKTSKRQFLLALLSTTAPDTELFLAATCNHKYCRRYNKNMSERLSPVKVKCSGLFFQGNDMNGGKLNVHVSNSAPRHTMVHNRRVFRDYECWIVAVKKATENVSSKRLHFENSADSYLCSFRNTVS